MILDPNKHGVFNKEKKVSKLRLVTYIGQWILLMIVFVVSSIAQSVGEDPQGIWTAIWCLSMVWIVDMADKKIK